MGKGARTVSDQWWGKIERHRYREANLIGCGPPQDCGRAESKMGTGQGTTEEGSVNIIMTKPVIRRGGPYHLKTHPHRCEFGPTKPYRNGWIKSLSINTRA